ncbi:MAG TPA: imidazolonepropionase, partial [Flavobacterium sp.]|nr:imidazolonepropionase [Flavobacterium sp.]
MKTMLINIKELIQVRETGILKVSGAEMAVLPTIKNAYLLFENDIISDYGSMENYPNQTFDELIDATGRVVLPTWCDSHTHLVYAGNRVQEFVDRINGLSYEEIANRGGGILNSAQKLNETAENEIYEQSKIRLEEVMKLGTGAIEIKSGYGLTVEGEIKMLRVIRRLAENYPIKIKATFLGAHAFPKEYKENHADYIDLIINEMLPKIAAEKLADYIDAFLETGYFSVEETERIMIAGKKHGLIPKIHVNQFTAIGGIAVCVKHNALTVDHLEVVTYEDIEVLKNAETMAVALPSCSYFISIPYTPARKIIDAGLPLALATDYNPGTTPSGNMNFVVATACIKMKMTPEEAVNAATINGAYAMGVSNTHGSITKG